MINPGETIFNKYRVEKAIDKGGYSEVYLIKHLDLNALQAMKILIKGTQEVGSQVFSQYKERFLLEARLGASLHHPNIIRVYDFAEQNGVLALVMDYAPGGNLSQRINKSIETRVPISIREVISIGLDIAKGLTELHKREIIHRDLKPGNILFDPDGKAMIADLGIAQTLDGLTTRSHFSDDLPRHPGTPAYMSPEQENSRGYLKPPSDVYSLGLILFEMLTGRNYKNIKSNSRVKSLRKDVPAQLDDLIFKMLHTDPEKRPWDGEAVYKALRKITEPGPSYKFLALAPIAIALLAGSFLLPQLIGGKDTPTGLAAVAGTVEVSVTPMNSPSPDAALTSTISLPETSKIDPVTAIVTETSASSFPTITVTPEVTRTTIKTSRAWLRKGPDPSHPNVSNIALNQGDSVDILFRSSGKWFLVRSERGEEGWLYIAWIDFNFNLDTIPMAEKTPTSLPVVPTAKPAQNDEQPSSNPDPNPNPYPYPAP